MGFEKAVRRPRAISTYISLNKKSLYIPSLFYEMFGDTVELYFDVENKAIKIKSPGSFSAHLNGSGLARKVSLRGSLDMPLGRYFYDKTTKSFHYH